MKTLITILLALLLSGCYTYTVRPEDAPETTTVVTTPAYDVLPYWYGWYNPWYPLGFGYYGYYGYPYHGYYSHPYYGHHHDYDHHGYYHGTPRNTGKTRSDYNYVTPTPVPHNQARIQNHTFAPQPRITAGAPATRLSGTPRSGGSGHRR